VDRRIDGDHDTRHQRKQDAVLIPVAVILVLSPGATYLWIFQNHLGVVVVDFALQELLHGTNDSLTASDHAVDAVARVIPQRHAYGSALAVIPALAAAIEFTVFTRRTTQQVRLFGVEEGRNNNVAIPVIV
jgi:hypothetical protein